MEIVGWHRDWQGDFEKLLSFFLNGRDSTRLFDQVMNAKPGPAREGEAIGLLNRFLEMEPRIKASAQGEFLSTLQHFVNQWLASGRSANGDCPSERKVPVQILQEFIRRNPPYLDLKTPSGPLLLDLEPLPVKKTDPLLVARDAATFLFLKLMDSPERARLSRCDVCERYFVRARIPKKDFLIYRGCFCVSCKGKGSMRRTNVSRDRRKNQLVKLAANWWPKWESKNRKEDRSKWVARKVNENLPRAADEGITGKWITQNQAAIETEVASRTSRGKGE
jgi:hypothetical protein